MFHSAFRDGLFRNKRILVTGGGSGIGRCTAHELASLGAHVILAGRKEAKLIAVQQEINSIEGQRCDYVVMDVRNAKAVLEAVQAITAKHGCLHGLVNNAGGQFPAPAENITENGWKTVIDLNLNGTWNLIKAVQSMHSPTNGPLSIVNVTADVRNGKLFMAHTAAARAGVENLAKTLSQEWGNQGIRVNCVAPGTILGNGMNNYSDEIRRQTVETHYMNPLGRLGTEAEISAAIVFLLSPASSYITGTTLQVTGGAHLRKGMEDSFIPYSDDCVIPAEFGFDTITRGITGQPGYFQNPIPSGFEGLGGGGLVILKHKSWHVYNEKNRERVRKDEEKAKQEDDEKKGRAVKADQEYRLGVLRSRAGSDKKRSREDSESKEPEFESAGRPGVHLNLFGDLESGKALHRDGSNVEHEQEKAKEKAKFEKQFTMYLGQEVGKDGAPTIPWYAKESSEDKVGVKKLKTELLEDPAAKFISADRSERLQKEGKEVKKDKKKDKSKKHNHTKHEAKSKSMEELRKERMEREARERKRAEELLKPAPDSMERSRGYNSAFNPELSRRR